MDSYVKPTLRKTKNCLSVLSVEPIAVFMFLGFALYLTCLQTGLYNIVCYQLYYNNATTVDCLAKNLHISIQNNIQQSLTKWTVVLFLAYIIPGMVSSCVLGAWSDTRGRKTNLLISITGMMIGVFPLTFMFTFRLLPLWILAIFHFIAGSMGFLGLIVLSSMSYLSDTVADKKNLTIRMAGFSVLMSVAGVIGALLSGGLLRSEIGLAKLVVLIEILLAISFCFALFRLEQLPPEVMRKKYELRALKLKNPDMKIESAVVKQEVTMKKVEEMKKVEKKSCCESFVAASRTSIHLMKQVVHTYNQQRPGRQRAFLLLTTLILFLHMMADLGLKGAIMGQYVFREPFSWTDGSQLGYWRAASSLLTLVGNMGGIVLFKKVLKMHDTMIMMISILSGVAELVIIGLSTSSWMLYLAVACGCMSHLIMPTIGAFTSNIVKTDEVGKAYVAHSFAMSLAFVISMTLFNGIYKATLEHFAGAVFLVGATMLVACFFIVFWIHLTIVRQDKTAANAIDSSTFPQTIAADIDISIT